MKEKLHNYVDKPWGSEQWVAVNEHYAFKIITLNKGERTSLQYHNQKEEHIYLWSGLLSVEEDNERNELIKTQYAPGEIMHSAVRKRHRITALETSVFMEVSTPFLNDVVRIADDYQR